MMYGGFFLIAAGAAVFLFVRGMLEEKAKKERLRQKLIKLSGSLPTGCGEEKARNKKNVHALRFWEKDFTVDEATWNDLDMEAVFERMNYTVSQIGEIYLYTALHCPAGDQGESGKWDGLLDYFHTHPEQRVQIQMLLSEIGKDYPSSSAGYLEKIQTGQTGGLGKEYAVNALYFAGAFLVLFFPEAGICLLAAVMIYQIVTYFKKRKKILPSIRCMAQIVRMAECMDQLSGVMEEELLLAAGEFLGMHQITADDTGKERKRQFQRECRKIKKEMKRHSFWIMQCGRENSTPLSLFGDYIRMLFHTDLIEHACMERRLLVRKKEILKAEQFLGFLDAGISIVLFRTSLPIWCAPHVHSENTQINLEGGIHPLLKEPAANSISMSCEKGILLTGSNASGKSTFLKMTAVNLLLAQSAATAAAESLQMPFCRIYTSLTARDSIEKGESSYVAEIRSLKRIIDAPEQTKLPVCCFIDEILRGTGTVERIAAAAQILKYIHKNGLYCVAATHDRELTKILEAEYENYHFREEIKNGDISFSYKLLKGSADTNNAFCLLEMTGYVPEIIQAAKDQAERFRKEGIWK